MFPDSLPIGAYLATSVSNAAAQGFNKLGLVRT
jgi:hypothetical protein